MIYSNSKQSLYNKIIPNKWKQKNIQKNYSIQNNTRKYITIQ